MPVLIGRQVSKTHSLSGLPVLSDAANCSLCEPECGDGVCVVDNKDQTDMFGTACVVGDDVAFLRKRCGQLLVGRQDCDASNMCIGAGVLDYAGILGHGTWCCSLEDQEETPSQ